MGMFDALTSDYPLPHHQDGEFQTKDLAHMVHGEFGISGFLDEYRITADGRLMLHRHVREWRDRPGSPLGGYLESVRDWWEEIPDVHGDIRIYTRDEDSGNDGNEWVEFRIRFTHGRVERVDTVQTG
ncbi:MAG: hypothetical protein JJU31_15185 [Wenzhouxiangella sp.]|nr:hypothetical protein [Wenzhouxiangella sp.]MCH8479253.1 hypothetical protein [Wenzhouxiangella sp.]